MRETWALAASLGVLGLLVGSFLALVSVRWPAGEGIVAGRSRCRACGKTLSAVEVIPLASYLAQRGRCRACGARIDVRHPLIELASAGIGVWAALAAPSAPEALVTAALGWALLLIAVIDAEHFWLPDALTVPLLAAGLAQALAFAPEALPARAIGAAAGFLSLAAIAIAYKRLRGREGLGGGDPRLFAAAGAWVGWMGLPSVLLWASAAALSLVAARVLLRRAVRADDRLPLGTYLALGLWLTWLFGPLGL